MYDFLIVGAGLFGSVCARRLKDNGFKVLVIDKRNHIGGNCYTENIEGINVHKYGAHIFHTSNEKVWSFVNKYAVFNNFINSPIAKYKNECYNLPFNMNTFTKLWSDVFTPKEVKERLEQEKPKLLKIENLEHQALSLVGKTIYEKLIKGYTEKQWGKECKELPAFIIKRLPLRFTFDNNYFNDKYQGIPVGGYTKMFEKLLEGIELRLNVDFFEQREELLKQCKKVIYTGPIDKFFNYQCGTLEYRSVRFETEVLDEENYQGNAVINYTDIEVPYTRIFEHKHFEPYVKNNKTIISKEYSHLWRMDEEPYYPINDGENMFIYDRYKQLADKEKNVYFGGRLAEYSYYDMDDIIDNALKLTDKIIGENNEKYRNNKIKSKRNK